MAAFQLHAFACPRRHDLSHLLCPINGLTGNNIGTAWSTGTRESAQNYGEHQENQDKSPETANSGRIG